MEFFVFWRHPEWICCMLTSLSACRRSLSTSAGPAPAWWWWNCLEHVLSFFFSFFLKKKKKSFLVATLETNERTAGWTNKAGDQGRVRRDSWVFFCFPFNSALQMVLRERRPSRHYEPVSLSLVDRPALLGTFHILHILTRSRIFIDWAEL